MASNLFFDAYVERILHAPTRLSAPTRRIISPLGLTDLCVNIPNLALTLFRQVAVVNVVFHLPKH
jgi:hypothetical protein